MLRKVLMTLATFLTVAGLLAGCATDLSPPPQSDLIAVGFYLSMHEHRTGESLSAVALDRLRGGPLRGKYTEGQTIREGRQWWCQPREGVDAWGSASRAFAEVCRRRGGSYEGGFCSAREDRDKVLFMAKVTRNSDFCSQVHVQTLEPVGPSPYPGFTTKMVAFGFKTSAMLATENAARQRAAEAVRERQAQAQDLELARAVREWPQMQRRGTTVCRKHDGVTYVAFVEDFSEDKLKLLVSRAYITLSPGSAPGGFRQEIIWANPIDWFLCSPR
ncbi:hypothetical protein ABT392_07820 [Paucibacter sp. JuS9]|uniref:hypothetical protein n=1 Tax=Paucibacter sp. JuS9 TaxID=3228748 RepID=UPI0037579509